MFKFGIDRSYRHLYSISGSGNPFRLSYDLAVFGTDRKTVNSIVDDHFPGVANTKIAFVRNDNSYAGWNFYIAEKSFGLTTVGIQALNNSIRNYVICILGCQVETRSDVFNLDAQKEFINLFEDSVNTRKSLSLPNSIKRFQDYVTKAKIHLNYVIAPKVYLFSNDLVMQIGRISGYNNTLIVATADQQFGVNAINSKEIKPLLNMDSEKKKNSSLKVTNESHIKPKITSLKPPKKNVQFKAKASNDDNVKMVIVLLCSLTLTAFVYFKKN